MVTDNSIGSIPRVARDLANLQQNADLSLAAAIQESDIRYVRALVIGPADTPYEHAFFEFDFKFPSKYPMSSPKVKCITTNDGCTRFNPNIYSSGKVCLSILGTWYAENGESWSCVQSLESVLMSIQSLMGANPYENEPGMEGTPLDDRKATSYARKVRHESLRVAVIERLEWMLNLFPSPEEGYAMVSAAYRAAREAEKQGCDDKGNDTPMPDYSSIGSDSESTESDQDLSERLRKDPDLGYWNPFCDLIKRRFFWYYDTYMQRIADASTQQDDGVEFELTQFEGPDNKMEGKYRYQDLTSRMNRILNALHKECDEWIEAGVATDFADTPLARRLALAFATCAKQLSTRIENNSSRLEIELPDPKNILHWKLTIYGQPMSNLDGGFFTIQFVIPPDFPEAWPRVRMISPIYHRNVSSTGTICFLPAKPDDIQSHLDAIVAALDDKEPVYDPRAVVNPTAAAQFWSSDPEQRKVYTRMLRRSVQNGDQLA